MDATGNYDLSIDDQVVLTDNVTNGPNSITVYNLVYNPGDNTYYGTGLTVKPW